MSFIHWLGAVFTHWVALMSGVLSLAIGCYIRFARNNQDISNLWFFGVGLFAVLFSTYQAWNDEHAAYLEAVASNEPQLVGNIEQMLSMDMPSPSGASRPLVVFIISLSNTGAPSVADRWFMSVKSPGFQIEEVNPVMFKDGWTVFGNDHKPYMVFSKDDTILTKAMTPVQKGARIRGRMWFLLPEGCTADQIRNRETTISVTFEDIREQKHAITPKFIGDGGKNEKWYPGTDLPARMTELK